MTDQLLDQVRDLAEGQIVSTQSIISYAIIFARGQSQPIHTVHKRCKADSLILIRVPTCRTLKDRDWLNSSQPLYWPYLEYRSNLVLHRWEAAD